MKAAIAGLILALVGGCTHRAYAPQAEDALPLPEAFTSPRTDAEPAPAADACSTLGLPSLDQLLVRQRETNWQQKAALARVAQARAVARQAGAARWPRLDGAVGVNRAESRIIGLDLPLANVGPSTQYQGSVAASWELDVWKRLGSSARAAVRDAEAATALAQATMVSITAELAETWAGVLARRELLQLLDEQTAASQNFLRLTRLRFAQGQATAVAVAQQQLQLESLRTLRAQTTAELRQAEAAAQRLTGSVAPLPSTTGGLPAVPARAAPALPANLADRRPDVRAARLALEAADYRTAAALARRLPGLRLTADLVSVEDSFSELFAQTFWSLGAALTGPVFDAGALRAAQAGAESRAEEALYDYASAVLNAFLDVQAAIDVNVAQAQVLTSIGVQREAAARVLELATEGYRQGSVSYLDVLTALQSQQQVDQQWVTARAQQFANRVQLCRALGVGVPGSPA